MFILNWDFDVLPITFDENFMLCQCNMINVTFLISNSNYHFMDT